MTETAQNRGPKTEAFLDRQIDVVHLGGVAVVGCERREAQAASIADKENRRLRGMPNDQSVIDLQHGLASAGSSAKEGADARGDRITRPAPARVSGVCLRGRRDGWDAVGVGSADDPGAYYVCGGCGISVPDVHSWTERRVRDLPWGTWQVWLVVEVHRVRCRRCGVRTERLPFVTGKVHYTTRLEAAVDMTSVTPPRSLSELY